MFNRIFQCSVVAAAVLIMGPATASATIFSGDPFADGWLAGGLSTQAGTNAGPAPGPNFGPFATYRVYSHTTTIIDNAFLLSLMDVCGITCSAWQVGDTIVGLGAVFPSTLSNPSSVNGGGQGSPATLVVKWGVTASIYSISQPDTLGTNANRNHDVGDGGIGSVLAELNFGLPLTNVLPTAASQWTGLNGVLGLGQGYIVFNSTIEGQYFRSFEAYLNVTRLNADNPNSANGPLRLYDGSSIVGVRNYINGVSGFTETNALINGVPEPATGLLAAGALLAGWVVRRRSNS